MSIKGISKGVKGFLVMWLWKHWSLASVARMRCYVRLTSERHIDLICSRKKDDF